MERAFRLPESHSLHVIPMSEPKAVVLSVVIPTYNRAALVPRAVRSVLSGAGAPVEILVVDDGSQDDTEAAVAAVDDDRVRYMRIAHGGVSTARNAGARAAVGRWLAFLDSDDEVLPGWADTMLATVERSGCVAICGGEAVGPSGQRIWLWTPPGATDPLPQQLAEMFLPGMFVLDRRAFVEAAGYVESLAFGENTELALRLLFLRRSPVAVEAGVLVRRHVSTPREAYSSSRIASARYVTQQHPWIRRELPSLWASYHALIGVDEARQRRWPLARQHFLVAVRARPSREHLARLLASCVPLLRSRTWPGRHRQSLVAAVVCPGAGRVARGYETFAIELARNLQGREGVSACLMAGGQISDPWASRVPTLSRSGPTAKWMGSALRLPPVLIEQVSFAVASLPALLRLKPDTVLFSERAVGSVYVRFRRSWIGRVLGFDPLLVLSNGGGSPPPYPADRVQHVTPVHYERALTAGVPPEKHVCLPYGFEVPGGPAEEVVSLPRRRVEVPVVLSVGSLDGSRKRMDHVIREVARLEPRPYLILLGQESEETPALKHLAKDLLGEGNYEVSSAKPDAVGTYYERADVFVLASTEEAFGRVYIEAMMHGLPCIAHDFPVARYVLGDDGTYVDMTVDGELASALKVALEGDEYRAERRRVAVSRFGWDALMPEYLRLLRPASRPPQHL